MGKEEKQGSLDDVPTMVGLGHWYQITPFLPR